jgi:hypothetical protein
MVFVFAWLSCFLLLAVPFGVVVDCKANVVPFPTLHQVMGDFHQFSEESGRMVGKNSSIR